VRKSHAPCGVVDEAVAEGVLFVARSAGLQPGALVSAIHVAPALTAVRNRRRVNLVLIVKLYTTIKDVAPAIWWRARSGECAISSRKTPVVRMSAKGGT